MPLTAVSQVPDLKIGACVEFIVVPSAKISLALRIRKLESGSVKIFDVSKDFTTGNIVRLPEDKKRCKSDDTCLQSAGCAVSDVLSLKSDGSNPDFNAFLSVINTAGAIVSTLRY